jgi:hypothetical protein
MKLAEKLETIKGEATIAEGQILLAMAALERKDIASARERLHDAMARCTHIVRECKEPLREYKRRVPDYADTFTVEEWQAAVARGSFNDWDGSGYWAKDGNESEDEVFSTPAEDATHVAWYNK